LVAVPEVQLAQRAPLIAVLVVVRSSLVLAAVVVVALIPPTLHG
jgi:hypothetical protein